MLLFWCLEKEEKKRPASGYESFCETGKVSGRDGSVKTETGRRQKSQNLCWHQHQVSSVGESFFKGAGWAYTAGVRKRGLSGNGRRLCGILENAVHSKRQAVKRQAIKRQVLSERGGNKFIEKGVFHTTVFRAVFAI